MDHAGSSHALAPSRWSLGELTSRAWFWPVLALALMFLVDAVVSPGFFSIRMLQGRLYGSLIDVLYRGTPTALVALGMAVVIGTKGIDLSVGAVVAIVGAVMTNLIHRDMSPPLVARADARHGPLCGLWNGFLVAILDIQPIIATLILMVAGRGIALLIDDGLIVTFRSDFFSAISTGEFLTVPSRCIVAPARSYFFGWSCAAPRSASSSSRSAPIPLRLILPASAPGWSRSAPIRFPGFARPSRACSSAPISAVRTANNAGLFIELDAILAVVIGGGSLMGGRFYLGLTIVGVLIIQGLTTSILVSGLPAQFNMIVKGVVVLIVLLLQSRRLRQSIVGVFRRKTS